jgi:hypothetical protein
MKKDMIRILLSVFLVISASSAIAAPLSTAPVDFVNVSPGSGVTFVTPWGVETWNAGVYNFTILSGQFTGTYGGFCVDPASSYTGGSPYPSYDINAVTHGMGRNYDLAAYLLNKYYSVPGRDASATQAAIWELMFESSDFDYKISSSSSDRGNFYTSNSSIAGTAQSYIDDARANGAVFSLSGYYLAQSPAGETDYYNKLYQDYVFKTPEPMSILLLGAGLISLAGLRRKE